MRQCLTCFTYDMAPFHDIFNTSCGYRWSPNGSGSAWPSAPHRGMQDGVVSIYHPVRTCRSQIRSRKPPRQLHQTSWNGRALLGARRTNISPAATKHPSPWTDHCMTVEQCSIRSQKFFLLHAIAFCFPLHNTPGWAPRQTEKIMRYLRRRARQ